MHTHRVEQNQSPYHSAVHALSTPYPRPVHELRRQEHIMAWHRSNMAFDAYTTTYQPACREVADRLPGGSSAAQRLFDSQAYVVVSN